jgi:hypothetical protein
MQKEYFIYHPLKEGKIEEEWDQCLKQIRNAISNVNQPVKINIFTDLADFDAFLIMRKKIIKSACGSLGDHLPAISFTAHPPEKPWKIAVEALFIQSGFTDIITEFFDTIPYVVIKTKWGKEIWAAGLGSGFSPEDTRIAAETAFNQAAGILQKEKMTMNNIIRQWNYIGNILNVRKGFQNYQIFNEVRSEYYNRYRTVHGYPAATGIGMGLNGVIIDFCAVQADGSVQIRGLSNPNQVNAYEYGQIVLKGIKETGKPKKQPPQFERALLFATQKSPVLYISGTASIKGQETIGIRDVKKQTLVTIDNIKKLADLQLIKEITGKGTEYALRYTLLRVYIKYQKDFVVVRKICEEMFPSVPAVFIQADICRDNLLTEIEAELVFEY